MKQGRTLVELATEIQRQQESKKDFIADTRAVTMDPDGASIHLNGLKGITQHAHGQIAGEVGIPKPYYDRMRSQAPELLANNVNHWFQKDPKKRMFRTLDGDVRALMSDSYRPLDNMDLASVVLPAIDRMGLQVVSSQITETKMYIKAVDREAMLELGEGIELGKDHKHFKMKRVCPALNIGNSEVGCGSLFIDVGIMEEGCTNLLWTKERSLRKYHVGGKILTVENVHELLTDQTRAAKDAALWLEVRDVVNGAMDRAKFNAYCQKLVAATQEEITGDPVKVIEVAQKQFGWTDKERGSVLTHLIRNGDLSKYGLQWAVTRAAEDLDSYDRASEFEKLGGEIIELPKADWQRIATVGA